MSDSYLHAVGQRAADSAYSAKPSASTWDKRVGVLAERLPAELAAEILRQTLMDCTFVRAIMDGSADEGYSSIHLKANGTALYEEKVEVAMPPHKIYLHTYNVTTFAGTHEVANEALVLKLHTCVSHGVAVRQPARGGKPRLGGRPAFLAAPLPRMGWQRPACGCQIPAPFATLARREDRRAHTVDDAGRLSDAFEITVPLAFLYDPAMMPFKACEEPAHLGTYRLSQLPEAEREAHAAAYGAYCAFMDWSCEHYQRVSVWRRGGGGRAGDGEDT